MTMPRSKYVRDGEIGVYHCFNRCVRRAFLCGFDPVTHRDFSHRRAWVVDRLRFLANLFAIDICSYTVLMNHYHLIVRLRPDIAASWSDREVAIRWLMLSPKCLGQPTEIQILPLICSPQLIEQLRRRLSNLSWFMAYLDAFISRAANKEDGVKGRFWESRFQCQALLDNAAIAAGMVYADLNPIRAGIAPTPEDSDFTSIQERIRAWRRITLGKESYPDRHSQTLLPDAHIPNPVDPSVLSPPTSSLPSESASPPSCWLCPIQSNSSRLGLLPFSETDYFDLIDKSGRMLRSDKRGSIDPSLAPILLRIGANPQAWHDTVSRFRSKFRLAAGLLPSLRSFASQLNQRWIVGVSSARVAFASSPPQAD